MSITSNVRGFECQNRRAISFSGITRPCEENLLPQVDLMAYHASGLKRGNNVQYIQPLIVLFICILIIEKA